MCPAVLIRNLVGSVGCPPGCTLHTLLSRTSFAPVEPTVTVMALEPLRRLARSPVRCPLPLFLAGTHSIMSHFRARFPPLKLTTVVLSCRYLCRRRPLPFRLQVHHLTSVLPRLQLLLPALDRRLDRGSPSFPLHR